MFARQNSLLWALVISPAIQGIPIDPIPMFPCGENLQTNLYHRIERAQGGTIDLHYNTLQKKGRVIKEFPYPGAMQNDIAGFEFLQKSLESRPIDSLSVIHFENVGNSTLDFEYIPGETFGQLVERMKDPEIRRAVYQLYETALAEIEESTKKYLKENVQTFEVLQWNLLEGYLLERETPSGESKFIVDFPMLKGMIRNRETQEIFDLKLHQLNLMITPGPNKELKIIDPY